MSLILPRRDFLKGLFIAPAIVAASNIMPIKVITDLAEAAAITTEEWALCAMNGEYRWMSKYDAEIMKFPLIIIRTLKTAINPKPIDTTVELMKAFPGSQVIWELPYDFRR